MTPQPSEQPDATIRYREHTEKEPGHRSWWRCIPISDVDLFVRLWREAGAAALDDPNDMATPFARGYNLGRGRPAADPVATPPEALRLLRKVLDEFDFWVSKPRPAIDGGIHNFQEVQPNMEQTLAEARRYLASTEEGTP